MGIYLRGKVWWVDYVYRGKRYRESTGTDNRKLAQRYYDKIKGEIAEGRLFRKLPGEKKTFREMMEKYLDEHVSKLKSRRAFTGYSKNLISFFGDYKVSEISPKLINEYKIKRLSDGIKPSSLNRELATMKKAFNLAMKEWEWVIENPAAKISLERENNKRDRWLTYEEEERLLKESPSDLKEIITLALNTGMRIGEILNLKWKGVDLFRKTITIFESKNNEKRTIPMNNIVFEMLKAKAKVRSINNDIVFSSNVGTLKDERNVRRKFELAVKRAGIEDFRFHDLRHTFATRLVQEGCDFYKVQRLLGHKTPLMTQRYAHHYPESLRDAVNILSKHVTNLSQSEGKEI